MRKNNINLRILFFMLLSIVMINTNAQTGLNFQGVARTTNNVILASQAITIKLSILQGSSTGIADYVETRKVTTNAQGLFTAVIGDTGAISTLGNFTTINWKLTPKFLKIEMDAAAGTNFITMGTTQFQYVAYAQFAKTVDAENITGVVPVARGGTGANSLSTFKTAMDLDKVNNTTDLTKPISTLTQTALDLKLNAADTSKYTRQTYLDSSLVAKQVLIGLKLNAADTSKFTKQTYSDSALLTKLKVSDTAVMLSSRIAKDTLNLSNRINLKSNTLDVTSGLDLKLNKADTIKFTKQTYSDSALLTKLKVSDTAVMLSSRIARDTLNLSNRINLKANTTDVTTSLSLKESISNKSTAVDLGGTSPSDILFPTQKAVKDYVAANNSGGGVADGGITTIKLADAAVTDAKINTVSGSKVIGSITGNAATATLATTATTAGNITATSNTTLTSLSSLATVGTITSGIWSGTAVTVEKGGTGGTTASAARTNLGLAVGSDVLSYRTFGTAANNNTVDFEVPLTFTSPLSRVSNTISIPAATTSVNGYLSSADWTTFNAKQTALTAGSGISISAGTISATGLTTSNLSSTAGITNTQLAGSISASKLVGTDITTLGTITSGVWSGTAVAVEKGGTGATSASAARTNLGLVIGTDVQAPLVEGTDYLAPTGSAASLTNFPTFNQNTTGNAATATTAGNITATTNTTLTSLSSLATVGTITSGVWSGTAVAVEKGGTGLTAAGTAGQILTSTGSGTLTWTSTGKLLSIGDVYQGGIVAYILQVVDPGYDATIQKGIIAATSDQSIGIQWYNNGSYTTTGATGTDIGTGLSNTNTIIASQDEIATSYAAGLARAYTGGGYSDWYLPSKDELAKLYAMKLLGFGGFANSYYWSSTENGGNFYGAWLQDFYFGSQYSFLKNFTSYVRAIRAFSSVKSIEDGGTGATTQQTAINALTGTQISGSYLRSDGTNSALSTIQVADVPTLNQNTSGNAATATTAENITATTNTTLTSLSSLTSVGTIASLTTGVITNSGKVIVGASSAASASAVLEASSTTQGFLPPRMTKAQRDAMVSPVAGLMIWCSDNFGGEIEVYNGSIWVNMNGFSNSTLSIGNYYQGGKIAHILVTGDPGYDATTPHGLIAATSDQSTGIRWYNGTYTTTGATGTAIGTGLANTNTIITSQGGTATSYAAGLARAYTGGGYSDWYLPSKDELYKLFLNKVAIGGFAGGFYWSSTESDIGAAWSQGGADGGQSLNFKNNPTYYVRAIRAF